MKKLEHLIQASMALGLAYEKSLDLYSNISLPLVATDLLILLWFLCSLT